MSFRRGVPDDRTGTLQNRHFDPDTLSPDTMLLDFIHAAERRILPARARRWRAWKHHIAGAPARVDHRPWDDFLGRYAHRGEAGVRVRYSAVSSGDRTLLGDYIEALEATAVSTLDRPEQFAFWANLYNAVTVRVILDHLPLASLRSVGLLPFWLAGGPWEKKRLHVEGWRLSLNDIEHRILRRNWRDRRVHYALNCGAAGCPDLPLRAFSGATLETDLDRAERSYVNDPRGVAFEGERLIVSSLYVWFTDDFVSPGESIVYYLRRHADPEIVQRLAGRRQIDGHRYDWALNAIRD